jgi:signal transduction histidine kinase
MIDELNILQAMLDSANSTDTRIDALNQLAQYWHQREPSQASRYAQEAVTLATSISDPSRIVTSYLQLTEASYYAGDILETLKYALETRARAKEFDFKRHELSAINMIGIAHQNMGDLAGAQQCYQEAFQTAEALNDQGIMAGILANMGTIYGEMDNHEEAESHLERAICKTKTAGKDEVEIAELKRNLSVVYHRRKEHRRAIDHAEAVLTVFEKHQAHTRIAFTLDIIGSAYMDLKDFEAANNALKQAMQAAQAAGSEYMQAYIERQQAALVSAESRYSEAIPLYQHALSIFDEHGDTLEITQTHKQMAAAYRAIGDYQKALEQHEAYHAIYQKTFDEQSDLRLKSLQVIYQVEQARKELETRSRDEEQRIAVAVERERVTALRMLFNNLYHDLMTPISIIKTSLYLLGRIRDDEESAAAKRETIQQQVDTLTRSIERMMLIAKLDGNAPDVINLTQFDLQTSLQHALHLLKREGQDIERLRLPEPESVQLSADPELLQMAIKELLDNALRYSPASTPVIVSLEPDANKMVLSISDQGQGITSEELLHIFQRLYRKAEHRPVDGSNGLGLPIARLIIEKHGGHIKIESKPDEGTIVYISLPLHSSTNSGEVKS